MTRYSARPQTKLSKKGPKGKSNSSSCLKTQTVRAGKRNEKDNNQEEARGQYYSVVVEMHWAITTW